jgi:putative endonuclease
MKSGLFHFWRIAMCYVYILYSSHADRYYVGQSDDLQARLHKHNSGKVPSTKAYVPWEMKYHETYSTRGEAMRREREIKARKSRKYIESLLAHAHAAESRARD